MSRLREPEELLLKLRQAVESHLHSQVTSGDHHADRRAPRRGDDEIWQVSDGLLRLDFQDDAGDGTPESLQARLNLTPEALDVRFVLNERVADQIGVRDDGVEIGPILVRQGGQAQVGLREVQPLFRLQLGAPRRSPHHLREDAVAHDLVHLHLHLPLVYQESANLP